MRILSFDVASKSLALSIINFNDDWKHSLNQLKLSFRAVDVENMTAYDVCDHVMDYMDKLERILDDMFVPELFDVVDLIPGKKLKDTTPIVRANRLNSYLSCVDRYMSDKHESECKVLLEYQMGPNDKSRNVCSQILYHFSNGDGKFKNTNKTLLGIPNEEIAYDVEIVGPSLKNKINFDKDKPHQYFIQKYAKTYDANKKHSVWNFLRWVDMKGIQPMIVGIPKKNMDDIADSVNMTLAWLFIKSGLIYIK